MLSVARLVSFWRCIPVQYNCQKSSNFQGLSHFSRIFGKNDKIPGFSRLEKLSPFFQELWEPWLYNSWKHRKLDEDGVLYRVVHQNGNEVRQLVLPSVLKQKVLTSLHDECGHQGLERTFELVRSKCF